MRIAIVGAGAVGVHHAVLALELGHEVVVIEQDPAPRRASVRNFGLVWLSGRRPGPDLDLARRARERWAILGARIPALGFRPAGSLTLARSAAEVAVLEEFAAAAPDRGLQAVLLDPAGVRAANPALGGDALAGLLCRDDAVVEPRAAAPALLDLVAADGRATVHRRTVAREVVATDAGVRIGVEAPAGPAAIDADVAIVCPGADLDGPFAAELSAAPLDRCQLEMLETEPVPGAFTTALADGDSLRYYPGFSELPAADDLPPAEPLVAEARVQLLVAPRLDGALTVGDSHRYDEPFAYDLDERVADHWLARLAALTGAPAPAVRRRWTGVYSRYHGAEPYLRLTPLPGVHVVTGLAGRGMTGSPGVALDTMELL